MELDLFAACLPGLEPLLQGELRALGAAGIAAEAGGVAFRGPREQLLAAHLHLGTASHVLLRCGAFRCRTLSELVLRTAQLPWAQWLRADLPFEVHATCKRSRMYHTGAIEERVHKGIASALGVRAAPPVPAAAPAATPTSATSAASGVAIAVRVVDDVVTLSLDTSATPLHRRGYRLDGRKAPLREDLAHALLRAAGFDRGTALLDPFCGSGTIAIEAAAIAMGLPPGRLRPAPLQGTALADDAGWQQLVRSLPAHAPGAAIRASDRDAGAIEAARSNAERAGVASSIELSCCAFTAADWLADPQRAPSPLLLATNPPFGRRIGTGPDLGTLWQALGHRASQLEGARLALVAHDPREARRTALPLRVAFATRHGGLRIAALISAAAAGRLASAALPQDDAAR